MFDRTSIARISLIALCASFSLVCIGCDASDGGQGEADAAQQSDSGTDADRAQSTNELDILWVIDNSASMCEEQAALRANFGKFVDRISAENVDFHIGVTTTQMDSFPLDPVAEGGHLQSTPQPLPSGLPICRGDEGDPDAPMDGFVPIRETIELAVECTEDPSEWAHLRDVTDEEIACQLIPGTQGCSCNDDTEDDDHCRRENLFPAADNGTSPYRQIPKVLRRADYQTDGSLDRERLQADFACMSMVGSSGYAIEKGLLAATEAVSPELTGGTVENPTDQDAPNHGFLRDAANFSVIFVTDENDCSHDGTLDQGTTCGGDVCAFANHPDTQDSPLIRSEELAQMLEENLSDSKGYSVANNSIAAASIHGQWKRYGAEAGYPEGTPPATNECTEEPSASIEEQPSCQSAFGTAYSGDRYERFLREFTHSFPDIPQAAGAHVEGLICRPAEFGDTLERIGQTLAASLD